MATAPNHRGRGVGANAVQRASGVVAAHGASRLYLDCVYGTGFLVTFYQGLGFTPIDRREVCFPGGSFDMVLMEAAVA